MRGYRVTAGILAALVLPSVVAVSIAESRRREDTLPAPLISNRIRERMEALHSARTPQISSASELPDGGPGYESILIKGQSRTFLRYTPNSVLISNRKVPVVFVLHGRFGVADRMQAYFGMNAVAQREGFIVVYPQGVDRKWHDGREADDSAAEAESPLDDSEFLNTLADALVAQGIADPDRMYLAGMSNGGFMALHLACQDASRFTAYAVIAASLPEAARSQCAPRRPVPVVMINGTADAYVRYDGAASARGIKGNLPVPDAAKFLADLNGCQSVTETAVDGRDSADPTTVSQQSWTGCKAGGGVALYTVNGGGHQAPATGRGPGAGVLNWALGPRSHQIDTAETVWSFFKKYQR